jgi:S-formylglutathione hydrolase FrmB
VAQKGPTGFTLTEHTAPTSASRPRTGQGANPTLGTTTTDHSANPEGQDTAANSLCSVATANGITCAVVTQQGKHDWPFGAHAFATSLPWLATTLGTSNFQPVQLPERGGGAPH